MFKSTGIALAWIGRTTSFESENLASAYLALYDKTAAPRRLDDALAAIAAALDGYRKAKAPFYIEKAKRLQSQIFAARRK